MRVTFLSPVGVIGGGERVLLTILRTVKAQHPDFTPTVILLSDGPLSQAVQQLGAQVRVVPLPTKLAGVGDSQFRQQGRVQRLLKTAFTTLRSSPAMLQFLVQLRRAVHESRPDIIHSNGLKTHLLTGLIRPATAKVVWHLHDFYTHRPLIAKILKRFSSKVASGVAISEAVKIDTAQVVPTLPITVILNAVDTEHYHPLTEDGAELDRLAGLPTAEPGTVRIGLIATYANWKGHRVFLDALAKLGPQAGAVRGYIIGGPIYTTAGSQVTLTELQEQARELGISERVGFIPFQTDTACVDAMLDIVVHASIRPEPFGLTIAEAMSCGRPVIVAAAGGALELFTQGHDGMGHEPGNADQLAVAMTTLASDAALRQRLGAQARETAVARFSLSRYGQQLTALYRSLLPPV